MAKSKADRYAQLQAELLELQEFAKQQTEVFVSSTNKLYEGLARVYLWWREAKKEKGLLERLYVANDIQYKKVTDQKVNYSPLLRYLWNMESKTSSAQLHIWSRALNKINAAFGKGDGYFDKEPVLRIVEFINLKHGLTKLAGFEVVDMRSEKKPPKVRPKKTDEVMCIAHLAEGNSYYELEAKPIATISLAEPLPTTDEQNFVLAFTSVRLIS